MTSAHPDWHWSQRSGSHRCLRWESKGQEFRWSESEGQPINNNTVCYQTQCFNVCVIGYQSHTHTHTDRTCSCVNEEADDHAEGDHHAPRFDLLPPHAVEHRNTADMTLQTQIRQNADSSLCHWRNNVSVMIRVDCGHRSVSPSPLTTQQPMTDLEFCMKTIKNIIIF